MLLDSIGIDLKSEFQKLYVTICEWFYLLSHMECSYVYQRSLPVPWVHIEQLVKYMPAKMRLKLYKVAATIAKAANIIFNNSIESSKQPTISAV